MINSYEPLADWFCKLEFLITYFSFNDTEYDYKGTKYERYNSDIQTLQKMMSIGLMWLKSDLGYSKE